MQPYYYTPRPDMTYTQAARADHLAERRDPSQDSTAAAARALDTAVGAMVANGMGYPPVPEAYFVVVPNNKPLPPLPPVPITRRALGWLCCGCV